ncbi:hypothetical protein ACS0TY_011382 [Phlomoides rotata]
MVKPMENVPPFLVKCYEMVDDESTNDLISWTESNDSFMIRDESKFSSQLLPKYFKHNNFSSFVRQLNIYGFRKIDTDRWQFANESFIKGQKHLLKNIVRRKHSHNVVQKNSSQQKETVPAVQSEEDKRMALWKEVECLATDKNALTLELKKLRQHQENSQSKLLLVKQQLKGMEKNQQQMLSFIVMAMQSPEFMASFFPQKENSWRMTETGKNKLSEVTDDCDQTPSDGMIIRYQPPQDVLPQPPGTTEASNSEDFMEWNLSSDEMRDLLMDVDLLLGPTDEKLLPLGNHGELILPDIPENDKMLEQLLLPYPSTENEPHTVLEGEAGFGSRVHFGSIFQPTESEESNHDVNEDQNEIKEDNKFHNVEKVEDLTEQMGSLTSEISSSH